MDESANTQVKQALDGLNGSLVALEASATQEGRQIDIGKIIEFAKKVSEFAKLIASLIDRL